MLKKLIMASAILALFACSSDNDDPPAVGPSSSGTGNVSSSSGTFVLVKDTITVEVHSFRGASEIFKTYPYSYTKKGGVDEDLTLFWDPSCPLDTGNDAPGANCELDKTNAMLQNKLTSQYASLHYIIDKINLGYPNEAIELKSYNLTEPDDQVALGMNVYTDAEGLKNIEELGIANFNTMISFFYKYWGGAHEFRAVSKTDDDFWYYKAGAKQDTSDVIIPISNLIGMGSFAADEEAGTGATPFDISKVAKFLWVIDYEDESGSNKGSLLIDYLRTRVEREREVEVE